MPGDSEKVLNYKSKARAMALRAIEAGMAPQAIINAALALRSGDNQQTGDTLSVDRGMPEPSATGGWGVKELE